MKLNPIIFSEDTEQTKAQIRQLKITDPDMHEALFFDAGFNTYLLSQIKVAFEGEVEALEWLVKVENKEIL